MNRIADEEGLHPRVLLEVNVAGEGSKIGFSPNSLRAVMETILDLPRLTIEGLMTIPPLAPEAEDSRRHFIALRELREQLATEFQVGLPQLSMGMTNDFTIAIEEGATMVRVGTAIFGDPINLGASRMLWRSGLFRNIDRLEHSLIGKKFEQVIPHVFVTPSIGMDRFAKQPRIVRETSFG